MGFDQFQQLAGKFKSGIKSLGRIDPKEFSLIKETVKDERDKEIKKARTKFTRLKMKVTPKEHPLPPLTPENSIQGYNLSAWGNIKLKKEVFNDLPEMRTAEEIQKEIDEKMRKKNQANPPKSPITGRMIEFASRIFDIDPRLLFAILHSESRLGIEMRAKNNPGNVGVTDEPGLKPIEYPSIWHGVFATARELYRRGPHFKELPRLTS